MMVGKGVNVAVAVAVAVGMDVKVDVGVGSSHLPCADAQSARIDERGDLHT